MKSKRDELLYAANVKDEDNLEKVRQDKKIALDEHLMEVAADILKESDDNELKTMFGKVTDIANDYV